MVKSYTCLCCNYLFVYKHMFFLDPNWISSLYVVYCMVMNEVSREFHDRSTMRYTVCHNSYFYFDMNFLFIFQYTKYVVLSIIQRIHESCVCVIADKMIFGQIYYLFPLCV